MPCLGDMLDKIGKSRVLSKLDLTKGFHQVTMDPEHSNKTAFVCPYGKFKFTKMPFGLCNGPAVFQKLMETVLREC